MISRAKVPAVLVVLALCVLSGCGEKPTDVGTPGLTCTFGNDEMVFPEKFSLFEEKQSSFARIFESKKRREPPEEVPFRPGVKLFIFRGACIIDDGDSLAPLSWDNIGHFLTKIDNAQQCQAVIELLHQRWYEEVSVDAFRRVVRAVESDVDGLPLKVLHEDIEEDLIAKGLFRKDGYWLVNFIAFELASAVEYKYAIDSKNRFARIRRVLIEGPPYAYPGSMGVGTAEGRERERVCLQCVRFLRTAAKEPDDGAESDSE